MKTYHIGFIKGTGGCHPLYANGHKADTLIVEAKRNVDSLSCNLWTYYGERVTTKRQLHKNRFKLLGVVNKAHGTNFKRVVIS